MNKVIFKKNAFKDLKKLPNHILKKLRYWVVSVEMKGIEEIRKIPGYHDEILLGSRKGQRSVRLSRSYRTFYIEYKESFDNKIINIIKIIEVNNHEY